MKKLLTLAPLVVGVALLVLSSPLLHDDVVDEELPTLMPDLIKKMESLTQAEVDAMKPSEREYMKGVMEEVSYSMPDTVVDEGMGTDTAPEVLSVGMFHGADGFHKGVGNATVYRLPDGSDVLRFTDFSVTNGPALSVYLVKGSKGIVDSGHVNLGRLKGNIGNQNYPIPAGTDLSEYGSVVVYCVPFRTVFAVATLKESAGEEG